MVDRRKFSSLIPRVSGPVWHTFWDDWSLFGTTQLEFLWLLDFYLTFPIKWAVRSLERLVSTINSTHNPSIGSTQQFQSDGASSMSVCLPKCSQNSKCIFLVKNHCFKKLVTRFLAQGPIFNWIDLFRISIFFDRTSRKMTAWYGSLWENCPIRKILSQ